MSKRDLKTFVKQIGLSRSYQEESLILEEEFKALKSRSSLTTDRESLRKILFLSMLGYETYSWHHLGMECAASKELALKQMGYLLSSNFVPPCDPIRVMIVNTIINDLKDDYIQKRCALLGLSYLMTEETVPIFVNDIDKLLTSNAPPVRRMAIAAMQKANAIDFTNKQQETIASLLQVLCDRDPSVMGAGLPFVHELLSNDSGYFDTTNFASCIVYIFKQVIEGKLSSTFDYYAMPSPWMQVPYFSN